MLNSFNIIFTEKCNFSCSYCYARCSKKTLAFDGLCRGVDVFLKSRDQYCPNGGEVAVSFLGGEPLVEWALLSKSIRWLRSLGREMRITLTTNGSLLTAKRFDFLQASGVRVIVSLDGQILSHDIHRRDCAGKGTAKRVLKNILLLPKKARRALDINMVVTPETVAMLFDNYSFVMSLGVGDINFDLDLRYERWDGEVVRVFRQEILAIAKDYLARCQNRTASSSSRLIWLKKILNTHLTSYKGYQCPPGRMEDCNTIWMGVDKRFYICQIAVHATPSDGKKWCVGDLKTGIDLNVRDSILGQLGQTARSRLLARGVPIDRCFLCPFHLCMGSFKKAQKNKWIDFYCELLRAHHEAADWLIRQPGMLPMLNKLYRIS